MFRDVVWEYKGHKCEIQYDHDDDCIKAFYRVTKPDGERVSADISPYERSKKTVELWIDAGYPKRFGIGPLHREDIEKCLHALTISN